MSAPPARTHFIGIGGAGMSVVAELFLARGHAVSGSDAKDSPVLARLAELGAEIAVGHDAAHVQGAGTVVVSTAVRDDNPELVAARAAGAEVIHRSVALARAAADHDFVAVAGAHGKTTTTGMLAVALTEVGADPSYAIGGALMGAGTGAHLGTGAAFVAEADESDSSFLNYSPRVAVVTNVEADHLDRYGSSEAVQHAFEQFVARIEPGGLLVACADDRGSAELAGFASGRNIRVQRYGVAEVAASGVLPQRPTGAAPDVLLHEVCLTPEGSSARLEQDGQPKEAAVELTLHVPGEHNLRNAVAAWCVGVELGVDRAAMAAALASFTGTARRFELRGEVGGVRVVDDYAHHPTEVAELLKAARRSARDGRVLVLFQPHLYSRTQAFQGAFAAALSAADHVVLTGIYGAREDPVPGVTSQLIAARVPRARYLEDRFEAAAAIAAEARAGDLVLTVGAGDVTELGSTILAALEARG